MFWSVSIFCGLSAREPASVLLTTNKVTNFTPRAHAGNCASQNYPRYTMVGGFGNNVVE